MLLEAVPGAAVLWLQATESILAHLGTEDFTGIDYRAEKGTWGQPKTKTARRPGCRDQDGSTALDRQNGTTPTPALCCSARSSESGREHLLGLAAGGGEGAVDPQICAQRERDQGLLGREVDTGSRCPPQCPCYSIFPDPLLSALLGPGDLWPYFLLVQAGFGQAHEWLYW